MEIILTENVKGLGNIGEVVNVKPGYARNFLIPKGMAVEASQRNMKELEHHKRQLARKAEKLSQEAADVKARIEAVECTFMHKALQCNLSDADPVCYYFSQSVNKQKKQPHKS